MDTATICIRIASRRPLEDHIKVEELRVLSNP